jgi:hypothetical protein
MNYWGQFARGSEQLVHPTGDVPRRKPRTPPVPASDMDQHPLTFPAGEPLTDARGQIDALRIDLNWVHRHKSLFWQVIRALDRDSLNPPPSQTWRAHYARLYVDGQSVAVRRLTGGPASKKDACLYRILSILSDNANTITIDRIAQMHAYTATGSTDPDVVKRHAGAIEREWGNGTGALDTNRIRDDLATLRRDTESITTWATKTVAHLDRNPPGTPTFGELDAAIADVTAIFRKYGRLLTGQDYAVDHNLLDLTWWLPLRDLFSTNGPEESQ